MMRASKRQYQAKVLPCMDTQDRSTYPSHASRGFALVMIAVCLLQASCNHLFPEARPEKIGTTHVAVLSVAHWDDYAESLQPTFKLSPDDALKKAIPTTAHVESKLLKAVQAALKIAPPTNSTTTSTQITTGGDVKSTINEEKKPGDVSTVKTDTSFADIKKLADLPGSATDVESGLEPILQFSSATALYQEVQLLNRYVRDAARLRGYAAYVVRMQVSLMPRTRDSSYDALTHLAFFTGPDPVRHLVRPKENNGDELSLSSAIIDKTKPSTETQDSPKTPYVIPLFVTDTLESAVHSQTEESLQQFVLGIGALVKSWGAAADFQKFSDQLEKWQGRDLNSLMTVGRISGNMVRVRLGAVRTGARTFAMVPQTHYVTLLLLVPPGTAAIPREMHLVARTTFYDARTGSEVKGDPKIDWKAELEKQGDKYRWTRYLTKNEVSQLMFWARDDMYPQFVGELNQIINDYAKRYASKPPPKGEMTNEEERLTREWAKKKKQAPRLGDLNLLGLQVLDDRDSVWTDLISLNVGSRHAFVQFDLPPPVKPYIPRQIATAVDDGKKTVVAIRGARNLRASRIIAHLELTADKLYPLYPNAIEVIDNGRGMDLSFASLKSFNLKPAGVTGVKLEFDTADDNWETRSDGFFQPTKCAVKNLTATFPLKWPNAENPSTPPTMPDEGFKVICGTKIMMANTNNHAEIHLSFMLPKDDSAELFVEGADFIGAAGNPPDAFSMTDGKAVVKKSGVITLSLGHLEPSGKVTIRAQSTKGQERILVFDVRPMPIPPK